MNYGIWGIVALLCAVWVIYEVLVKAKKMSPLEKVVWIILALLFSILTAIVYYFVKRR